MFKFKRIVLILIAVVFSALLYACKNTSTTETTTPVQADISMRVSNGYIQWRVGDGQWNNLIAIDQLKGQDGKGIRSIDVNDDNELVITYDDNSTKNLGVIKGPKGDKGDQGDPGIGIKAIEIDDDGNLVITLDNDTVITLGKVVGRDGQDGKDGREVEFRVENGYIEWRYKGEETWTQLIPLSEITGPAGQDGQDGQDGREVEFRLNDGYLQWRYVGEPDDAWDNLFSLDDIRGEDGEDGLNGLSAYELYKLYNPNYDKTEEEWLSDLINGRLAEVETVTITFHPNNGDAVFTEEVVKGHTTNLPILERLGYRFLGWYSSEEDSPVEGRFTNFIPVVRDIDLYARWELIPLEGIILTEYELELEEEETYQIEVTPVPDDALLPELVFETSDPTIATVDADGLITAIKAGTVTITVRDEDSEFVEIIELTVVDKTDPVLISVEPEEGEVVIKDGESFVLIVRAFDKNLYKLEVDHSLEGILPEFNVYADEDNPYGSEDAKNQFEAYGASVTFDADTQTWTIDFGAEITANFFLAAQQVRFFIVIHDIYGNTWGTMYGTTPENTFVYEFEDYYEKALNAIKSAETTNGMLNALTTYQDAVNISEEAWDLFNELPDPSDYRANVLHHIIVLSHSDLLGSLEDVKVAFEFMAEKEYYKYMTTVLLNNATDEETVFDIINERFPELFAYRQELLSLGTYPDLVDDTYTEVVTEINVIIDANNIDKLTKISAKLLEFAPFTDIYDVMDALASILISDLYNPELVGVEVVEPIEHDNDFVLVKDKFVWIIKASDQTLFKLEVDHSFEGTLPEFSVYASEDNPYGSLETKAEFEAFGVTVTYDADTQTWTIDFGTTVTAMFLDAGQVTFYIVLYDEQGYTWGSMYNVTPENTFTYVLKDYYEYAYEQIMATTTAEALVAEILKFQDAVNLDPALVEAYEEFSNTSKTDVATVIHAYKSANYLNSLSDIKYYFEHLVTSRL
ncbi:MAG: hypothetical protein GX676_03540 [Bacilli bacterium]|nr:hypothetical protein [Bacilli bacterium]